MTESPLRGRATMTIGEVLAALQAEFADVSVSKIRFLESEGLIEPERTASGYRKFSGADLDRLRLILRLQRDSFLPLKVIKERLEAGLTDIPAPGTTVAPPPPPAAPAPAPEPARTEELLARAKVELTEADLGNAAELDASQIDALREYGVICPHARNGSTFFDGDDLRIAKIARGLLKLGIEPRHMKTLRRIAEQQADMLGQIVAPALRNRRPEARRQALDTLSELADLARDLHQAFVTQSLRSSVGADG